MNLELHVIQNVAPANLNRDDTGAPKDAVFGGHRRARVSSQAWKRAIRQSFSAEFGEAELAVRTRRLVDEVAARLAARGRDHEQAQVAASTVLEAAGAGLDEKTGRTKVLWLVARRSIDALAVICEEHWDALVGSKKLGDATAKEVRARVQREAIGAKAVDIALFGRMLTDAPEGGTVDAAAQVAHAISTHAVATEFDYFTAVDDLTPDDETGAGMLGTVEFNSACLYRYSCLDTDQLVANLDGDRDLALRGALAFARGFVTVMPTGKQNTFAAHNPPAAAFVVARSVGSWNLANAFVDPVTAGRSGDLVRASCERLARHWSDLVAVYGEPAERLGVAVLPSYADCFGTLSDAVTGSLCEVLDATIVPTFDRKS